MQQHCNPLGIIRTSIKTQAPKISMSCCFRMGKSKRKQAAQPVAVAAPTSPELSPSRKENQKPVQLTKLSFKRTRSSQVTHRHSTKIIRITCHQHSVARFCSIFAAFSHLRIVLRGRVRISFVSRGLWWGSGRRPAAL